MEQTQKCKRIQQQTAMQTSKPCLLLELFGNSVLEQLLVDSDHGKATHCIGHAVQKGNSRRCVPYHSCTVGSILLIGMFRKAFSLAADDSSQGGSRA